MAKGPSTDGGDASKMYSADVVAACLMASGTTSLSIKQYEMMSALDGTRTASSFQHSFRAVLAKSKELKARVDGGEVFEPVQPVPKRGGGNSSPAAPKATPKKRKAGTEDDKETPSRKKATPKGRAKKGASQGPTNDLGGGDSDDLPSDMDEFIKREQDREIEYEV